MTFVSVSLEFCTGLVFSGSWKMIDGEVQCINQGPRHTHNEESTCYRRPFSCVTICPIPHYHILTTSDYLISWVRGSLMSLYLYGLSLSVHSFHRHYADASNQILFYPILSNFSTETKHPVQTSNINLNDPCSLRTMYYLKMNFNYEPLFLCLNCCPRLKKKLINHQK